MNKARRKRTEELMVKIEVLREEADNIRAEEEEYRDNFPENLQGSERYETTEACVEALSEAESQLQEAWESLNTALDGR